MIEALLSTAQMIILDDNTKFTIHLVVNMNVKVHPEAENNNYCFKRSPHIQVQE